MERDDSSKLENMVKGNDEIPTDVSLLDPDAQMSEGSGQNGDSLHSLEMEDSEFDFEEKVR